MSSVFGKMDNGRKPATSGEKPKTTDSVSHKRLKNNDPQMLYLTISTLKIPFHNNDGAGENSEVLGDVCDCYCWMRAMMRMIETL